MFYYKVNYISHYFLDAQNGSPYHNFGLVLPDMMGAALRGWKTNFNPNDFPRPEYEQLIEGIRKHHLADSYFHSSAFFTQSTSQIRRLFEENGFSQAGTKLFFAAHIFLEFMLDRIIMHENPEQPKHFYSDVYMVEDDLLKPFFMHAGPAADRFFAFLENFRKHEYLYAYLETESLFYSLNRTLQRANQLPFPNALLYDSFPQVISAAEAMLKPVYINFFHEMKSR